MILQPSIASQSKVTEAYASAIARLQSLPLDVLDIYNIDEVPEAALYDLADQFNVLGLRGWLLAEGATPAETEAQRRALIKDSILLHKTAGTPFAIKRVLELVGYPNAVITENPGTFYDGVWAYDGSRTYSGAQLGVFTVTLDEERSFVSADRVDLIVALINEWKNARSLLFDLRIGDISLFTNLLQYDGQWVYNGGQEYDAERNI